jgi:gamma-glutamylcyclotransferase (GGCT)/AIG2-like uncharacterized protein YtfP
MKKIRYFAYGSNMDEDRMRERGVRYYSRSAGIADDFELYFNKTDRKNPGNGFANIVPETGKKTEGIVYEIDAEGLQRLDRFENFPDEYIRKLARVLTSEGYCECLVYIAAEGKTAPGLTPAAEYLRHLLAGKDYLSAAYYRKLCGVKTV